VERQRRRPTLESSWEWLEFAAQLPSKPVPVAGQTASFLAFPGRAILTGGFLQNTGGGNGSVLIRDGMDATGAVMAGASLAAGSLNSVNLPVKGILIEIGVYVTVTTATLTGALYVVPLWHYGLTAPGE
jgi:hypothetical protein